MQEIVGGRFGKSSPDDYAFRIEDIDDAGDVTPDGTSAVPGLIYDCNHQQ